MGVIMKVIATKLGYFGKLRQEGDVFEVKDDEEPATWFKPVEQAKAKKGGEKSAEQKGDKGE